MPLVILDGQSSVVTLDRESGVVVKAYKDTFERFGDFDREHGWLKSFHLVEHLPTLIHADHVNRELWMPYLGEPVTRETLPPNWRLQAAEILVELRQQGVSHNDIKPGDVLVFNTRLHLIDFGWATRLGVTPPQFWPPKLGLEWRAGGEAWEFDDRVSLIRSLEAVENGEA